ncbi:MAG: hypothetical protein NTW16_13945, partial [Bacteroidetes bacterium]|nr:hypothetical protein [Bacteroidota bacterium]
LIGSPGTLNSILAGSLSTTNAQSVYGIYNACTGNATISNNTIVNLKNATTNPTVTIAGSTIGIVSTNGANIISGNIIRDLSNANANTSSVNTASVCGIALTGATLKTVNGNTISNLSNNYISFGGSIIGIYFSGSTGLNTVTGNFINGLSASGASSVSASLFGIRIASGATTYSNNIICLGGNKAATIYGIYESGTAGNNNNLYFNTVYIDGGLSAGATNKSYALYSAVTTNTRNFRNNILVNTRSTAGGAGLHYAAFFNYAVATNLTLDYNDYYISGTGGMLGYYAAANKSVLPLVTTQDAHSFAITPSFANAAGTMAEDYKISANLTGVSGTGITSDYGLNTRISPTMGAWEKMVNKWKGTLSSAWNTAGNWTENIVPQADADVIFDDLPVNHCQLDQNRSVTNLINVSQSIPAGSFFSNQVYNLTINNPNNIILTGTLNLLNSLNVISGRLDASTNSPTIEFGGSATQSVPSGAFYNNSVYNLTINNANNVVLNGTLRLLNSITTTSGKIDAYTSAPAVTYAGTSPQTIGNNLYLNDRIHDLSIERNTFFNFPCKKTECIRNLNQSSRPLRLCASIKRYGNCVTYASFKQCSCHRETIYPGHPRCMAFSCFPGNRSGY